MKNFLKIDFYVQVIVFLSVIIFISITYFINTIVDYTYLFYFIVGGIQFLSFSIRSFSMYKKSILFKIYAVLVLPIWISLIGIVPLGNINSLATVVMTVLVFGLYSSPISAIIYIIDCYLTFKNYEKLHL